MRTLAIAIMGMLIVGSGYGSGQWTQLGEDIDGKAEADYSGESVSLSADGTIIAIGADGNDWHGPDSGHVRIYQWNGTAWIQRGTDIDGEAGGDQSGSSVSLSSDGSIVAIGAPFNDGNGLSSGHVRIYQWNGTAWVQRGTDIDGEAKVNHSGYSVSLSADGTIVAIGARLNRGSGPGSGHVRIYQWNGTAWIQRGTDIDGEAIGSLSGWSVSLSTDGNTVAIGAPQYRKNGQGTPVGHVRIYQWDGAAWNQLGDDIYSEAALDWSGGSVSLSADGTIVAVGAERNDANGQNSGHLRIYQWNGTAWIQRGTDIDGEAAGDRSGYSVSLSSDGSIVAIGASQNDGSGFDSGHVRIYQWDDSQWVQVGNDIDGEAAGDRSGKSVSLSADGTIIAIGADGNDWHGPDSGHVRIYQWTSDTPCTPCADVTAAAVEQLCKIMAESPPRSVLELQDSVNSIADTLLANTDVCGTNCDIAGQLNAAINQ